MRRPAPRPKYVQCRGLAHTVRPCPEPNTLNCAWTSHAQAYSCLRASFPICAGTSPALAPTAPACRWPPSRWGGGYGAGASRPAPPGWQERAWAGRNGRARGGLGGGRRGEGGGGGGGGGGAPHRQPAPAVAAPPRSIVPGLAYLRRAPPPPTTTTTTPLKATHTTRRWAIQTTTWESPASHGYSPTPPPPPPPPPPSPPVRLQLVPRVQSARPSISTLAAGRLAGSGALARAGACRTRHPCSAQHCR